MGDRVESLDEILHKYRNELTRYCKLIAGSSWDAEDLFQVTLTKIYQSIRKKNGLTVSKTYLFRVATNAWIDTCRKQKIPWEQLDDHYQLNTVPNPAAVRESMEELVDKLTPQQACIVLLVDIFLFTPKEAAEMVRSTEGAIKAALHRARTRMKTSVGKSRASAPIQLKKLIDLFISAFHSFDAELICRAYLSLQNAGYTVVAVTDQDVLYFRCQDPEGNVFHIYADTVLGSNAQK